jgi:hypothetical protein
VTRSGGWVELVDSVGLANGGPYVEQLMEWIRQLSTRRGVDLMDGSRIGEYLHATPLLHQAARRIDLPTGLSGGRVGKMVVADVVSVCSGYGGMIAAQGITTQQEWDSELERMQSDLNTPPDALCHALLHHVWSAPIGRQVRG